jgi:hypothetical protein
MPKTHYLNRKTISIENDDLRVTVTEEGGHIAEVFSKAAGVNPLWTPNWTSGEPSQFGPEQEAIFGNGVEGKLLYGILGHNLCLDLFGGPSAEEFAAGMTAHGEGSLSEYKITESGNSLTCSLHMQLAQLEFRRIITLHGSDVRIEETVTNLAAFDRPLAWTQHVTLSPPFLDPKTTQFRMTADRAVVAEVDLGNAAYLAAGKKFAWPHAPLADGAGTHDLMNMNPEAPASSYAALRMIPTAKAVGWTAWSPASKLAISYAWKPEDFPWLGIWEENCSRPQSPWNNAAVTRGMEFGTSPFAESRRQMVERGRLLDTSTFRWLPALGQLHAEYWIRTAITESIPETLAMPSL